MSFGGKLQVPAFSILQSDVCLFLQVNVDKKEHNHE